MDQEAHVIRMRQWFEIIQTWSASGQPKSVWCEENNISIRQFYYWQRAIRKEMFGQLEKQTSTDLAVQEVQELSEGKTEELSVSTFAEVPLAPVDSDSLGNFKATAVIRSGRFTIELANTASEELLIRIGKVMHHAL